MNKRIINLRVSLVCFVGLMIGIFLTQMFFVSPQYRVYILIVSVAIVVAVVLSIIYSFKVNIHPQNKSRQNSRFLIRLSAIVFVCALLIGSGLTIYPMKKLIALDDFPQTVTISGRVSEYVVTKPTHKRLLLKDCVITSDGQSQATNFGIIIYTSNLLEVGLGDKVTGVAKLIKYDFFDAPDFSRLVQNIGYSTYLPISSVVVDDGNPNLKEYIKQKTHEMLYDNLSSDNAEISYTILFGDNVNISYDLSESFADAGIIHILSVSGLHISVLVVAIYFVLSGIKMNRFVRLALLAIVLGFYCYLCSFVPPAVRSALMAIALCFCKTIKIEYDNISSLGLAGIIILLFNPLALFQISFQLSFMCMFAIFTFCPTITKLFCKIKVPSKLASIISMSIATSIVILPLSLNFFDKVSLVGIVTNIVVIPIFSVMYIIMFVVALLSLIATPFAILFRVSDIFLHLIKVTADYVSKLPIGVFRAFNVGYIVLLLVVLLCMTVQYIMVSNKIKTVACAIFAVLIGSNLVVSSLPANYSANNIYVCYQQTTNVLVHTSSDNRVTIIGSQIETYQLSKIVKKLKICKIDNLIAYDFELNKCANLQDLYKEFSIEKIYFPKEFAEYRLKNYFDCELEFGEDTFNLGDLWLKNIRYNDQIFAISMRQVGIGTFLVPEKSPTLAEIAYLTTFHNYADYMVVSEISDKYNFDVFVPKKIISHTFCEIESIQVDYTKIKGIIKL